ncbi:MAG: RsiV family protein [Minisyncoccota bacterium]
MRKDIAIGTVVILAFIAGIIFYGALKSAPAKVPGTIETSGTITGTSIVLPVGGYSEHTPYYDITANYPTTTPFTGAANNAAIALIRDFIGQTIEQFRSGFTGSDQGRKGALQIVYLIGSSAHTVSYIFTIDSDTGGVHGSEYFRTFVFDTATGQNLSLTDLFTPDAPYLDTLSQISRAKLPGIIGSDSADPSTISVGTMPDAKNFQNFFFDNTDFVILFPPYQVASYAAGPQTLRIPVSELSNILKPEYRNPA